MIIKMLNRLLKLTVLVGRQLVKLIKAELKRKIKRKENQITNLMKSKQQLNEELFIVDSKLENLKIEKGELEKAVEMVV